MVDKPFIYGAVNIIFELKRLMHAILPFSQGAKHLLITVLSALFNAGSSTYRSCCERQRW